MHNLHGYYINIEILFDYLKELNCPVVWTLHDCWPITGHCSHFTFVECDKWKTECYSCPQVKSYPASWGVDRSKNNFNLKKELFNSLSNLTLVPVSNWLAGIIEQSFFHDASIKVINNGINTNVFKPKDRSVFRGKYYLQDKFLIAGVANVWNSRKGLNDFIELSRLLNTDYTIVLVGLSRRQIEELPENILGIERTENVEELVDIYSASDVFLNTTYEDTFPTTNLEALACGTPVITYNTGGSIESIDECTGIVIEQGDIQGLVNAIKVIESNGKYYYLDSCKSRIMRLYKKEDRFKEYINLYENLLK